MTKTIRVACLGEAMVELSLTGDTAAIGFAGDVLNTGIYLRRALDPSHEVAFVSVIGQDVLSDRLAGLVESEGLTTRLLRRHPTRMPGAYAINTDTNGERSFLYWRDTSAARTLLTAEGGVTLEDLAGFDVLYLSAITLAILTPQARADLMAWLPAYRAAGGKVAFDSNYRPRLWPDVATARAAISDMWCHCDIGFPSVDDEMAAFGDPDEAAVMARFAAYGVPCGALKRGAGGPLPLGDVVASRHYPQATEIVDTTAAGDSFNGGFLAAYLQGAPLAISLAAGHDCAVRVIGHRGAIVPKDIWQQGI